MKTTGIAELKAHRFRYLASVKKGGEVLITDRGQVIARIVSERPADDEGRIARLRKAGIVQGSGRPVDAQEFLSRPRPGDPEGSVLNALLAGREEGW